jgi:hypothetical protein
MTENMPSWQSWAFRPAPACVVYVEYDSRGQRQTKRFDDVAEAHRFYTLKHRQGRRPKVVRVNL